MAIGPATDEMQLILELKQGKNPAAGALMDHYGESLMRYLVSILGTREAAEDAFQESWVKVMEKIGSFRGDMNFGPWLFRIARNTAYDSLRMRRRWWPLDRRSQNDPERCVQDVADPVDFGSQVVARQSVRELLGTLPPEFREVLFLRFIQDRSYQEISDFCHVPLGTIKSRLKRGLDHLARNLAEERR
jgi:RNA polymerase sigma-70 factor, ECF subfamily